MGKYLDMAKRLEAQHHTTVPSLPLRAETGPSVEAWPCPHCGKAASIDDVFPSLDGERRLTLWRCDPCQVVAVTPDSIQKPPTAWIRKITQ